MAMPEQAIDRCVLHSRPVGRIVDDDHDNWQVDGRTLDVFDPCKVVNHRDAGPEQTHKACIHLGNDRAARNQGPVGAHAGYTQIP